MVSVDTSLSALNGYMKKPLTMPVLSEALSRMGFDVDDPTPESLKVDITADRPDMVSSAGIARVLNAYLGNSPGVPRVPVKSSSYELFIDPSVHPIRPCAAAMVIKGLSLNDSRLKELIWVQEKIHATFARDRKKAAIGIYPLKKIAWPIHFKGESPSSIRFTPLGMDSPLAAADILATHPTGKKYAHLLAELPLYPVFRDAKGKVLSLSPIINSQDTGQVSVGDRELFVEVSGHAWNTVSIILDILAQVFHDMKGDVYSVTIHLPTVKDPRTTPELGVQSFTVELDTVNSTLGTSFTSTQVSDLLSRMMYDTVKSNPRQLVVETPSFRVDLLHEVDVVDDVARAYGFDNLQPQPVRVNTIGGVLPQSRLNEDVRDGVVGLGFQEVMTWHLTSHEHHFTAFDREHSPHVTLGVVKEQGLTMVRNMLYPETLRALLANRSAPQPFRLFELDQVVDIHAGEETGTVTHYKLCLLLGHAAATYDEMKGNVDALARFMGRPIAYSPVTLPGFIEGRTAHVKVGSFNGFLGEMHPRILERLSISFPVVVFECYLSTR
ncbi:MAG: phenylalanine--tRNA ligase subunit beta [archaeon]